MTDTVIFDMDGTLIDSEGIYNRCWIRAIREAGFSVTREQAYAFRSLGKPYAAEYFRKLFGDSFDYPAVRARRRQMVEEVISEEGLRLKPGAFELLQALRALHIRPMIATATDSERAGRYLTRLRIYDCFDRVISAAMVERGKPAPDIYLYACREAGRKPEDCIAVEDSPNGIRSAAAAGCRVVMVPDLTEPEAELLPLISRTVKSLSDLIPWAEDGFA